MASLSNINGLFDVHSTGAILFSTSHGTSGQILKSNGNAAPTWVDASTVIGGPYLPLSGGTLTGATATASGISFTVGGVLNGTSATFTGKVGIGTTTPEEKMVVMGNIGFGAGGYNGGVFANNNDSVTGVDSNWGLEVQRTANTDDYNTRLKYYPTNGSLRKAGIWNSRDGYFTIYSDDDTVPSVIIPTGNVGIGNTSPSSFNSLGGKQVVIGDGTQTNSLTLYSPSNGYGHVAFADSNAGGSTAQYAGLLQYYHADNSMRFYTNAGLRMTINSSGNVGIGTISPGAKLEVNAQGGGVGGYTGIKMKYGTSSVQSLYMGQVTAGNGAFIGTAQYRNAGYWQSESTASSVINMDAAGNMSFYTNSGLTANTDFNISERMRIDTSGNVGIGTTTPTALLDLGNSINDNKIHLYVSGNDKYGMGIRGSQFLFYSGGLGAGSGGITFGKMNGTTYTESMRVTNDGNVGIGTTSPEQKLHVEGTIQLGNTEHLGWAYDNGSYYNYITNGYNSTDGVTYRGGSWTSTQTVICHSFETYTGGWQKRLVIRQDGNVGIGTNSPSGPFHVKVGTSTPLIVASSSYCNNVGIRTTTPTASLQVKGNVSYSYNNYTNVANTWINVINFSGYPAGLYQISIIKKTNASTYITAIVKWSATAGTVVSTIASNQLGITFSGTQLQAISGIATGTLMSANLQCLVTNEDFCS